MAKKQRIVGEGDVVVVKPIRVIFSLVGYGTNSGRCVVTIEGCPIGANQVANLGSIFTFPPNLERIDINSWVLELNLPADYEYHRSLEIDRACSPPSSFITIFFYYL